MGKCMCRLQRTSGGTAARSQARSGRKGLPHYHDWLIPVCSALQLVPATLRMIGGFVEGMSSPRVYISCARRGAAPCETPREWATTASGNVSRLRYSRSFARRLSGVLLGVHPPHCACNQALPREKVRGGVTLRLQWMARRCVRGRPY